MTNETKKTIPEGCRENARGHFVPVGQIKKIDLERDSFLNEIFDAARPICDALGQFKSKALGDVYAFAEMSAEDLGVKIGGKKGNVTLTSFDGCKKVVVSVADQIAFSEQLKGAKTLIDECFDKWLENAEPEAKTFAAEAFSEGPGGQLSTSKILGLRRFAFTHPKWCEAMEVIAESILVIGKSTYIRFYSRETANSKWEKLALDLASA